MSTTDDAARADLIAEARSCAATDEGKQFGALFAALADALERESARPSRFMGLSEVAEHLGVARGTLWRLTLPEPDVTIGATRGWRQETIDTWNASRPGRGNWGSRAEKK